MNGKLWTLSRVALLTLLLVPTHLAYAETIEVVKIGGPDYASQRHATYTPSPFQTRLVLIKRDVLHSRAVSG